MVGMRAAVLSAVMMAVSLSDSLAPEEQVSTLIGTDSTRDYSNGNTLPITALPHGFNHWTLVTQDTTGGFYFRSSDRTVNAMRCTHQPSPWISDYGWFEMFPQTGPLKTGHGSDTYSPYIPFDSDFHPYWLGLDFLRWGARMDLAPTQHGAIVKLAFDSREKGLSSKCSCSKSCILF